MYRLIQTTQFRKDLKKVLKRNKEDFEKTFEVLEILQKSGVEGIPVSMRAHRLKGKYKKIGNVISNPIYSSSGYR